MGGRRFFDNDGAFDPSYSNGMKIPAGEPSEEICRRNRMASFCFFLH
jgi:hypothetical protein